MNFQNRLKNLKPINFVLKNLVLSALFEECYSRNKTITSHSCVQCCFRHWCLSVNILVSDEVN